MNNTMSGTGVSVGVSLVLGCLLVAALVGRPGQSLPVQQDGKTVSTLSFCYEAFQASQGQVAQRISANQAGYTRRCGELAQFKAFDGQPPRIAVSAAPRKPSGDCVAGRRAGTRPGIHQSAFSRDDCTNALNGNVSQRAERFWF